VRLDPPERRFFGKNVWWGKVSLFEEEGMIGERENEDLSKKGSIEGSVVF